MDRYKDCGKKFIGWLIDTEIKYTSHSCIDHAQNKTEMNKGQRINDGLAGIDKTIFTQVDP